MDLVGLKVLTMVWVNYEHWPDMEVKKILILMLPRVEGQTVGDKGEGRRGSGVTWDA